MSFVSAPFALVLGLALGACLALGPRGRVLSLLGASCALYAIWGAPHLLAVLGAVAIVSYGCGRLIERWRDLPVGRAALAFGIAACLGALALVRVRTDAGPVAAIGVSYYTLQAISYLLDVSAGVVPAERDLPRWALHLAFFPKLLQGPIERADHLLPQLRDLPRPSLHDLSAGARLFLWGLFQKVVVADRIAPFVDAVYGDVRRFEGLPLVIATWLLAAQLYYDFAGYTDMARGVARLFGIDLVPNFAAPYRARSIAEFWRRWHISFSSWLLDYVFRPLQLTLRSWRTWGTPLALVATFLVSGLWHGTAWTFVAWGALHGLFLAASALYRPWKTRVARAIGIERAWLRGPLQVAVTFHLVCAAWIPFRAASLGDALHVAGHAVSGLAGSIARVAAGRDVASLLYLDQPASRFAAVVAVLVATPVIAALLQRGERPEDAASAEPVPARPWTLGQTVLASALLYCVAFLGTATRSFVYQQF
jgi:D-alanyl-lipoteichoic acid acyltransferase DltB (MBOAT superfamily)